MADYYVYLPPINAGNTGGVTSLNGMVGDLTLIAGANITITPGLRTLTIAASGGGGGTPGGSNTQVQFNNSGAFGGDADFVWGTFGGYPTSKALIVNGTLDVQYINMHDTIIYNVDEITGAFNSSAVQVTGATLRDPSVGNLSIDWSNRQAFYTDGTTSLIDWSGSYNGGTGEAGLYFTSVIGPFQSIANFAGTVAIQGNGPDLKLYVTGAGNTTFQLNNSDGNGYYNYSAMSSSPRYAISTDLHGESFSIDRTTGTVTVGNVAAIGYQPAVLSVNDPFFGTHANIYSTGNASGSTFSGYGEINLSTGAGEGGIYGDISGNLALNVTSGGCLRLIQRTEIGFSFATGYPTPTLYLNGIFAQTQQSTPGTPPPSGSDYLYFKSDDQLYRMDSLGNEVLVGGGAASGADGSVQFAESGAFASDNSNLFWDNTNKRLGIGTNTPIYALDVFGHDNVTFRVNSDAYLATSFEIGNTNGSGPLNNTWDFSVLGPFFANAGDFQFFSLIFNNSVLLLKNNGNVIVPNGKLGVGTTTPGSALHVSGGGITLNRTPVSSTYTTTISDYIVGVTNTSGSWIITLLDATTAGSGFLQTIKDESGGAGTNNITIVPSGADTIDGGSSVVINSNYGVCKLYSNGAGGWFTL